MRDGPASALGSGSSHTAESRLDSLSAGSARGCPVVPEGRRAGAPAPAAIRVSGSVRHPCPLGQATQLLRPHAVGQAASLFSWAWVLARPRVVVISPSS